jgi:3-phosphoglycerate kinase
MINKIGDENCYNCSIELSKKDFKNAVISVGINDFKLAMNFKSEHFQVIELYLNSKKDKVLVLGNQFSEEAMILINKLKVGKIILINNVRVSNPRNLCSSPLNPIRIMIKE